MVLYPFRNGAPFPWAVYGTAPGQMQQTQRSVWASSGPDPEVSDGATRRTCHTFAQQANVQVRGHQAIC